MLIGAKEPRTKSGDDAGSGRSARADEEGHLRVQTLKLIVVVGDEGTGRRFQSKYQVNSLVLHEFGVNHPL